MRIVFVKGDFTDIVKKKDYISWGYNNDTLHKKEKIVIRLVLHSIGIIGIFI